MNGWLARWIDTWIDAYMNTGTYGQKIYGQVAGWVHGHKDAQTNKWVNEQTHGRMDVCLHRYMG